MLTPRRCGFSAIELMVVVLVLGVLLTLALPSFQAQVRKARRADAHAALAQLEQAQERWRSVQPRYAASLSDLGQSSTSANGHYNLATATETGSEASRYSVSATATGAQAGDASCKHLRIVHNGGMLAQQSGPDATYANDSATNRACWSL